MERAGRFEITLSPERRAELDALAQEIGTSPSALLRLGAAWVLWNSDFLRSGRRQPITNT
jgi:hypothetical protein